MTSQADKPENNMQKWSGDAPSNIALIKYMGKLDASINLPANASLSYTLNNLRSQVSMELSENAQDIWMPLYSEEMQTPIKLADKAQNRFLKHLQFLKNRFNCNNSFIVRSNNNFPQSCGIASSASSFAALTKCAIQAICSLTNSSLPSITEQAIFSRQGSGSSCRSFFSPWAIWEMDKVQEIDIPYTNLLHEVVIISKQEKQVSSSSAHKLIENSPSYIGRTDRATNNLQALIYAFNTQNWHSAYEICWEEFQDMHNLFNTCGQAFAYMNPVTNKLLKNLQDFWNVEKDGPIITMDAGPNIHLLYRPDQLEMASTIKNSFLSGNFDVI